LIFAVPVNKDIDAGMSDEIDTDDNAMVNALSDGATISQVKIRKLY
jgi:hypothetical protein